MSNAPRLEAVAAVAARAPSSWSAWCRVCGRCCGYRSNRERLRPCRTADRAQRSSTDGALPRHRGRWRRRRRPAATARFDIACVASAATVERTLSSAAQRLGRGADRRRAAAHRLRRDRDAVEIYRSGVAIETSTAGRAPFRRPRHSTPPRRPSGCCADARRYSVGRAALIDPTASTAHDPCAASGEDDDDGAGVSARHRPTAIHLFRVDPLAMTAPRGEYIRAGRKIRPREMPSLMRTPTAVHLTRRETRSWRSSIGAGAPRWRRSVRTAGRSQPVSVRKLLGS